jgi:hypothetical protein
VLATPRRRQAPAWSRSRCRARFETCPASSKPLVQSRTYLETLDLLLDLVVAVVWFTAFTTLIATGAGLLITLVGLPILTATFYLARAAAHGERARIRAFLGTEIERPAYKPPKSTGVWHRLIAPFADRTTWKELFYVCFSRGMSIAG